MIYYFKFLLNVGYFKYIVIFHGVLTSHVSLKLAMENGDGNGNNIIKTQKKIMAFWRKIMSVEYFFNYKNYS